MVVKKKNKYLIPFVCAVLLVIIMVILSFSFGKTNQKCCDRSDWELYIEWSIDCRTVCYDNLDRVIDENALDKLSQCIDRCDLIGKEICDTNNKCDWVRK